MTVKKRLALSNIIMIIAPVLITCLVGLLCVASVYFTMYRSNGLGFSDSNEYYKTVQAVSNKMYEIFEHSRDSRLDRLKAISALINKNSMYMLVYEDGEVFFEEGNSDLTNGSLIRAAKLIDGKSFVSDDNCQLYYYYADVDGSHYDLYLFNTKSHTDNDSVKIMLIISGVVVILAILLSIFLTDKFLIKFVFTKIEEPLDILSKGVDEISCGNLDYRLEYENEDEFLSVCRDFNSMADRLKRSVELTRKNEENRKELLLDISHDLRSPLTSIQAYVEGICDGVASTPEMQKKYLETIKRKTVEIEKLVSALFAYSKLDMEELETDIRTVDMAKFMTETVDSVKDDYLTRGLAVNLVCTESVKADIDEELFFRIISNILDNSVKYKTAEVGRVDISLTKRENGCTVDFSDDGPGVADGQHEKLFEIFYRTDKARNNPGSGSGIGLAFVKKAVEVMGGNVRAEKSKLGGLAIVIDLEGQQ